MGINEKLPSPSLTPPSSVGGVGGFPVVTSPPSTAFRAAVSDSNQKKSFFRRLKIPEKILLILAGFLLVTALLLVAGLVAGKALFKYDSLQFIPADAQFYLGISVRDHPQVQKMKALIERFPNGNKLTKDPKSVTKQLFGSSKDPLEDIIRLAEKEVLLAKVSKDTDKKKTGNDFDEILSVVDLNSSKTAKEKLNNFKADDELYKTSIQNFEDSQIFDIKLKQNEKDSFNSNPYTSNPLSLGKTTLGSTSVYATTLDRFIVTAQKLDDVKKSISLSKKSFLPTFLVNSEMRSILSDEEHKEISKYFPKEYLVKFFQKSPLEPFSSLLPTSSVLSGIDPTSRLEGKNYIEVNRGFIVTADDLGFRLNSYQYDWRTPKDSLKNPYRVSNSLATKIPSKLSGISPAVFAETNNIKQLMEDQETILNEVAERSDNRNQREMFKKAAESFNRSKDELRKNLGVDPTKDIFSWMDGKVAFIFNAGSKTKSPENLIVAEIKDKNKVESSLKKLKIPNYEEENKRRQASYRDSTRQSSLRSLASSLASFYRANQRYPRNLQELLLRYSYQSHYYQDPLTNEQYKYFPSTNLKSYRLEANLEDGRTYLVTDVNTYGSFVGTASKLGAIKPITPSPLAYGDLTIYSLPLYTYEKTSFSMFFAVTKTKAIVAFGSSDSSIKDIINFEKKPSASLSSNAGWKDQFKDVSGDVAGLVYVEPFALFGLWEYYEAQYFEDNSYSSYVSVEDLSIVIKAYLGTIKSIGTVISKEKPVYISKTFIKIEELPPKEKEKAEDSLSKLLRPSYSSSRPVLGIFDINWSDKINTAKEKIKQIKEAILK